MEGEKRFSKRKWLESANSQKEQGYLSEKEITDACNIWVDEYDGKTKAELGEEVEFLNESWFE